MPDTEQEERIAALMSDPKIRKLGRDELMRRGNKNPSPEEETTIGVLMDLGGERSPEEILQSIKKAGPTTKRGFWSMKWIEHFEGLILILTPIIGIMAVLADPSATNILLVALLLVVWKIANGAL